MRRATCLILAAMGFLVGCASPGSRLVSCAHNMRKVAAAKADYCLVNNVLYGRTVPRAGVNEYLVHHGWAGISCPSGGSYELRVAGTDPLCSIHGPARLAAADAGRYLESYRQK